MRQQTLWLDGDEEVVHVLVFNILQYYLKTDVLVDTEVSNGSISVNGLT